jgi:alpha-glucosidase
MASSSAQHWWHDEVVYQIYPHSFADASGDGVGDLPGIERHLPYLRELGVDAVWLSPIFKSPMRDFGYDVADYCAIDPLFGTMADFDRLLQVAHGQRLRLLLDFVPNHTSDQHEWFRQSRSSRDDPKRDWYIWKDPAPDGGPPNNWLSNFGGPAWTYDEASGQYYYHAFLASQPDLNWRNEDVRNAMFDVLRFWLDKGVDGFRVDVIWHLIKDAEFRDNPPNPAYRPGEPEIQRSLQVHSADQPEIHDLIAQMRAVIDEYDDRLLIGEIYLPLERLVTYYGHDAQPGVHLPFNFQLIQTPWRAERIAELVQEYEDALPANGWPNWVLSNHDQPRIAARVGVEGGDAQSKVAAMLLLTLRGTPTIYYGDEIGIADVTIPLERIQDPWAKQEPDSSFNRDRARTPMQWSDAPHAGFSEAEPWLPLTSDWQTRNVAAMEQASGSILALYRALLALRRKHAALRTGDYRQVLVTEGVFVFAREMEAERLLVALNFTSEAQKPALGEGWGPLEPLLSTRGFVPQAGSGPLSLAPGEGVVYRIGEGRR